jgi:hypothetical protein
MYPSPAGPYVSPNSNLHATHRRPKRSIAAWRSHGFRLKNELSRRERSPSANSNAALSAEPAGGANWTSSQNAFVSPSESFVR